MTRLRIERVPAKWEDAQRVVDRALASIRELLDRGWRWREQVRVVKEIGFDTDGSNNIVGGGLETKIEIDGRTRPTAVVCLRLEEVGDLSPFAGETDPFVISFPAVRWRWREGFVQIAAVSQTEASKRYRATFAVME